MRVEEDARVETPKLSVLGRNPNGVECVCRSLASGHECTTLNRVCVCRPYASSRSGHRYVFNAAYAARSSSVTVFTSLFSDTLPLSEPFLPSVDVVEEEPLSEGGRGNTGGIFCANAGPTAPNPLPFDDDGYCCVCRFIG